MVDTYKLKGLREKLIKEIAAKGIKDEKVLEAIRMIPRHYFVESAFAESSYEDRALPIDEEQTISQPFTVAYQSQLLRIKKGMKVLEIGTGSGYQAAILVAMGAKVFSIERHRKLHNRAKKILSDLELTIRLKWGDGTVGWETYAPFDRIIVTAASPDIPESLKKQLNVGGWMVIPVGGRENQVMKVVKRIADKEWEIHNLESFRFVPMIGKFGWKE